MALTEAPIRLREHIPLSTPNEMSVESLAAHFTPFERSTLELYSRGLSIKNVAKTQNMLRETMHNKLFKQQMSTSEKIWRFTMWKPVNIDQLTLFAYRDDIIPRYGSMRKLWKPDVYYPSEIYVMSAILSGHTTIPELMDETHFANGTLRTMMPKLYTKAQYLTGYRPENKVAASLIAASCGYISEHIIGSKLPATPLAHDAPPLLHREPPTRESKFEHLEMVRTYMPILHPAIANLRFAIILPEAQQKNLFEE
jgi:hypothetical protein